MGSVSWGSIALRVDTPPSLVVYIELLPSLRILAPFPSRHFSQIGNGTPSRGRLPALDVNKVAKIDL